ncbi:MAG: hybrid sensor histidine kinase/response regulator [Leptospiraceae bacterium]|nr:hybrid sensor histidine kinase/response regulator [Leptospiraceae bacterium]MCP5511160.1 hybrid sensor histidine kinase/response regulator [Leptospiraceae bacterium]
MELVSDFQNMRNLESFFQKPDILISIVDDDSVNRRFLSTLMRSEGFESFTAENGLDALEKYKVNVPTLILLDINMPEMDGFELIENLKKNSHYMDIPVIFLSTNDDVDNRVQGLKLGGVDFISKPFSEEEVMTRVKVHLHNFLLQRQLKELNEIKNKFFSVVSKDMKNNLSHIIEGLGHLQDLAEMNDMKSLKEAILHQQRLNTKTNHFLKNLIDWSSIQVKTYTLHFSNVSLSKTIQNSLDFYTSDIKKKHIKVNNQFSEKNLLVNVDEYSLKVIVDNLVSNAIKFTNYEESIDLSYKFQEDQILVSITNRGMYFPQSRLKNLFQIDKDTSNPKIEEEKGSGLGLILCKELVSKNGGEFSIDAYEETTKIIFTLNREK